MRQSLIAMIKDWNTLPKRLLMVFYELLHLDETSWQIARDAIKYKQSE